MSDQFDLINDTSECLVIPAFGHVPRRFKSKFRSCIKIPLGSVCFYCNVPLTADNATRDHFIPKSKGGGKALNNIVLACWQCNHKKGDRMPTPAEIAKHAAKWAAEHPPRVVKPKRLKIGPPQRRGGGKRKSRSAGTRRGFTRKKKHSAKVSHIPNKPFSFVY